MDNKITGSLVCSKCGDVFINKQNLNRHVRTNVCLKILHPISTIVRDSVKSNYEIISMLPSVRLKFLAAQRLGTFIPNIYPIFLCKDLPTELNQIQHQVCYGIKAIKLLREILKDEKRHANNK